MGEIDRCRDFRETLPRKDLFENLAWKKIVLLGPPGAGKTTLVNAIKEISPAVNCVSLGEITRAVPRDSELGKRMQALHDTVPPCPWPANLVMDMVAPYLSHFTETGFILDGVPKKGNEAQLLIDYLSQRHIPIDFILELQIDRDLALERLAGRISQENGRRPENLEHYRRRFQLHLDHIDEILKILHQFQPRHCLIDTTHIMREGALAELEMFLRELG